MESALEMLKALSDKNRLRIIAGLSRYEELCACQITELLQVTGATASRHLSVLQRAGLIQSRKEGRWVYFQLAPAADAESVMTWLNRVFERDSDIQADLKVLDQIAAEDPEEICRQQRGEACCPK